MTCSRQCVDARSGGLQNTTPVTEQDWDDLVRVIHMRAGLAIGSSEAACTPTSSMSHRRMADANQRMMEIVQEASGESCSPEELEAGLSLHNGIFRPRPWRNTPRHGKPPLYRAAQPKAPQADSRS